MRSTVNDIAKATGLAPGTVSRALDTTGKYAVSTRTREKVHAAAKELRYRPNLIGRALVAGSSRLVSLMSAQPFSEYYTLVARRLSIHAATQGYCLVNDCAIDHETAALVATPPHEWLYGMDGIFACDPGSWQAEHIETAIELQIPIVGLGVSEVPGADSVLVNLYDSSVETIRHLMTNGCRSIVMISDPASFNQARGIAFRETMTEAGLEPRWRPIPLQKRGYGHEATLAEIHENGPPDAFFCVNDIVAMGCYRGIADAGLRIPDDIMVAGCDGLEETQYLDCPLTTISEPIDLICKTAWDLLQARMNGYDGPRQLVDVSATLTIRQSTQRT